MLFHASVNVDELEKKIIPTPDRYIRGQTPAGIHTPTVIPAKAGIQEVLDNAGFPYFTGMTK